MIINIMKFITRKFHVRHFKQERNHHLQPLVRTVTRELIAGGGGEGEYSCLRVLPNGFLLKWDVIGLGLKKGYSRSEH